MTKLDRSIIRAHTIAQGLVARGLEGPPKQSVEETLKECRRWVREMRKSRAFVAHESGRIMIEKENGVFQVYVNVDE